MTTPNFRLQAKADRTTKFLLINKLPYLINVNLIANISLNILFPHKSQILRICRGKKIYLKK